MRKIAVLTTIVFCLLLQGVVYGGFDVGDIADNFTLLGMDEVEHSLYDYDGYVIFLDFFAYW